MDLDAMQVNFQSNTNSVDVEDTINEDDDVVELEEVQQQMNSKKCNQGKRKRRLTSPVWAFFEEFDTFESEEFGNCAQKTQLEQYLNEPRIDRNAKLDILAFWKANQFRYPELACMARDVLSIHVSTVASESAFSVGGRVVDQYRSALKPDTVQALVCTRDWIFGAAEAVQVQLDELTEDVMQMDLNKEDTPSTKCSNFAQLD